MPFNFFTENVLSRLLICLFILRLLNNALDKRNVRQQDRIQIIVTVAGNTEMRGQAWKFLANNFNLIVGR